MNVRLGSKVYYKDNGLEDTGIIVDILLDEYPFVVKWNKQEPSKFEERVFPLYEIAEALGMQPTTIVVNPADGNVDQYKGNQLVLIEY